MKICAAQINPHKGDMEKNISDHIKWVELAVEKKVDLIVFSELSLTGYEPTLAEKLGTDLNDSRLDVFQKISDAHDIAIGAGLPIKNKKGTWIGMAIFQPNKKRALYSKKYIHADEEPYFVAGENLPPIFVKNKKIAFSICYEISIPEHAKAACENGADIYIASVAKSIQDMDKAMGNLSYISRKYSMNVLMANCIGHYDGFECGGKSAIWDKNGNLLQQLNGTEEGLLVFDLEKE